MNASSAGFDPHAPSSDAVTPHLQLMHGKKSRVQVFYDELGDDWELWQARSRY